MNTRDLTNLVAAGESHTMEFKESFSDAVVEALVGMANANGGKVLVGVRDDHTLCGHRFHKTGIAAWLNDIKMKTSPALFPEVEILTVRNSAIAIFSIKDVPVKPISTKGKCFIRRGNSNHLMSIQEIADMYLKTYNLSWDSFVDSDKTPADLSLKKIDRFRELLEKQAAVTVPDDPLTLLRKFSLLKNERDITFAASLLFPANPPANTAIHEQRRPGLPLQAV